jgi:uncharacterized protein YjbI with pentapeptide repeats
MSRETEPNEDFLSLVNEWLREDILQKQTARQDASKKNNKAHSRWSAFWIWWKDYGSGLSTLITIISVVVGGIWTFNQFIIQEQRRVEQQQRDTLLQRQSLIAQFASELGDKEKRNAAAYSLAVLAGEDAIPILISHLNEVARTEPNSSFKDALTQALITIGNPSFEPVADINRQSTFDALDKSGTGVISATQPVILHFLKHERAYVLNNGLNFAGLKLRKFNLSYQKLESLDLNGTYLYDGNFCSANLSGVVLTDSRITDVELGSANLKGSNLTNTHFYSSEFNGADFSESQGVKVNFAYNNMDGVSFTQATLTLSDFSHSQLENSNFSKARLHDVDFSDALLYQSIFPEAILINASFIGTDLEEANLSGTDLQGARFFYDHNDRPKIPKYAVVTGTAAKNGTGAFVKGADFTNAQNVNNDTRIYLCRGGAINVPEGCAGIQVDPGISHIESRPARGGTGCF